jgi:tRNA A-37 threonylcarbamoyl transferase component Bud32
MSTHPDREAALFNAARRMIPSQRAEYLDEACAGDAELRLRIEELLRAHEKAAELEFLNLGLEAGQTQKTDGLTSLEISETEGAVIGRYKLLEKIGEGGFGVVYVAEQKEPVKRRVALKIIKLGMDTRQVVARFEAERQALALMDHPNIAKVLDAGATSTSRPFFVMELVRGVQLTDYCDQHKLSTGQRLDLFIQVCHAIQHAHQKGIIHRDIKPSNILVTVNDGVAVPKVIDFGIAKATQMELTEKTIFTRFQQFIGTPAYMSPEQAEVTSVDIDTRSDIYSLGVLLYELLTGKTPFDPKELLEAGIDEMRRTLREAEPARPSTRVNTLGPDELTTAAKRRSTDPPKLANILRGDLDWIVMKCLEKDRARRYETANGLAVDIQRHLSNEPVLARPPSAAYRLQKLVRRHKAAFAAAALVVSVLVLGIAASSWEAIRATRAEHLQMALREQAVANEQKAVQLQADAEKQRQAAEEARQREAEQRKHAVELQKEAEANAYASDMNRAQQSIAVNDLGTCWALLDRHRPKSGQDPPPDWEWRYLWEQCRSRGVSRACELSNMISSLSVSADGKWVAAAEWEGGGISILDVSDARMPRKAARLTSNDGLAGGVAVFSPREPLLAYASLTRGPAYEPVNSSHQSTIHLWNPEIRGTVAEVSLEGRCHGLAFSSGGERLLSWTEASQGRSHLCTWRVPTFEKLADYPITITEKDGIPSL